MTRRYLLPCSCGKTVSVETGQAGDKVRCACGETLDVPPMRQLVRLAPAAPADAVARPAWGARQGLMVVGCAIMVAALGVAAYLWLTKPPSPAATARTSIKQLDQAMKEITPQQSWALWQDQMLGEGLLQFQTPAWVAYRQQLQVSRHRIKLALAVAVFGLLVALAAVLLAPQQQSGEQQDTGAG